MCWGSQAGPRPDTCLQPKATLESHSGATPQWGDCQRHQRREQPARLPGVNINGPFGLWGDSWRRPACPHAARLPGNAAVTGSASAASSGLQGEEGKTLNAIPRSLHTTAPHPHPRHSSGSPVDSRGHRCDCPVLGGRAALEGQRATPCGHSAPAGDGPQGLCPCLCPRALPSCSPDPNVPQTEPDLECDHFPAGSGKGQPGAWGSVGVGSGAPCLPAGAKGHCPLVKWGKKGIW